MTGSLVNWSLLGIQFIFILGDQGPVWPDWGDFLSTLDETELSQVVIPAETVIPTEIEIPAETVIPAETEIPDETELSQVEIPAETEILDETELS